MSVFDECLKYGIEPLVTLSHYETPLNLALKYNGWENRKLVQFFKNYATTVFHALLDCRLTWAAKHYTAFVDLNNLTAHHYYDLGNVRQPGLIVMAGVKVKW